MQIKDGRKKPCKLCRATVIGKCLVAITQSQSSVQVVFIEIRFSKCSLADCKAVFSLVVKQKYGHKVCNKIKMPLVVFFVMHLSMSSRWGGGGGKGHRAGF